MGQKNAKSQQNQGQDAETVEKAYQFLFQGGQQPFTLESVLPHILTISKNLHDDRSFLRREDGFYVSSKLLRCVHHQEFQKSMGKLMQVLMKELKNLLSTRVMALVPRETFRKGLQLANFVIYFTDENLLQNVNLLNVRTDLTVETKQVIGSLVREGKEVNQFILQGHSSEEMLEMCKLLRLSLVLMIDLHLKLITRSDFTLGLIDRFSLSCFVLYCKLFFSTKTDIFKRERTENCKAIIKIGTYFLGIGIDQKLPSVYQLAALMLDTVAVEGSTILTETKALPSHLFKSIPIINNNEVINWLICSILSILKYKKQEDKFFSKLNINRIPSLKLLEKLFTALKAATQQITFMLEEVCLQTKPFLIERVYVSNIANLYIRFQAVDSSILKRFSQGKQVSYNVKAMNKQLKVKPQDIRTELQSDEESVQRQAQNLIAKYIIQVIFNHNDVLYQYSDKALWNVILYQLQHSETELSEKEPAAQMRQAQEQ